MKTISLLAKKGGTGKTTLCLHRAVLGNEMGQNAALIDIDPQASASAWRRRRQNEGPPVSRTAADDLAKTLADSKERGQDLILVDTASHSSHESCPCSAICRSRPH